ncbi:S8 family peptidase [Paenibacillus sp. N1-5-1-14]|uniref:S8 family peptidase n=1 Tax=Paenibacillus radicibacter TaxID=2972488 RepID=UPI0021596A63|nr:S8 family peptidase [Paenibacillus radicibacter]MCR8644739.1 S8 family peptidase [Paenibacillus radicibacter]
MNKLEPTLRVMMKQKKVPDRVSVIIRLHKRPFSLAWKSLQKEMRQQGYPIKLGCKLPIIHAVAAKVPVTSLHWLSKHHQVKRIYQDRVKKVNLNIATPSIGATRTHTKGITGKNVGIAIVDTGIYPHPDLIRPLNRIVAFKDFINGRTTPYDDYGHGTHVAGDAGGNGNSSKRKYVGTAPQAKLIGVKVLDQYGFGSDSTIIQGIQWCYDNRAKYNIRIINLSLGGTATTSYLNDPVALAAENVAKAGIVVVAAAGNSGPGSGTIESPGIAPSAITVGASDSHQTIRLSDDTLATFSSRGVAKGGYLKPDLLAPGVNVVSLRAPGSTLDKQFPENRVGQGYFRLSGTSMATPQVAGASALLLQLQPALTPKSLKSKLMQNAYSLGLSPNKQGKGIVNVRFIS